MKHKWSKIILFCVIIGLFITFVPFSNMDSANSDAPKEVFIKADITEQLIFDNRDIIIKAVSLDMNAPTGPALKFYGENSTELDRLVTLKYCSVNDIMVEPEFEMSLNAKGTAQAEAIFPKRLLVTAGIETFSSISFSLHIAEPSESGSYVESDQFNMITSMTGSYEQKHGFTGSRIADANGVKIMIGRKPDPEAALGKQIYIYIDNSLSEDIVIETKRVCIDGIELQPLFISTVCAGKECWAPLTFQDSEIIENGIVDINELTISFKALNIFGVIIDTDDCRIIFDNENSDS